MICVLCFTAGFVFAFLVAGITTAIFWYAAERMDGKEQGAVIVHWGPGR